MKESCIDLSLQYSTLRTLYLALSENQRGQNHFRSIGGLEVLLDGLGIPSNNAIILKDTSSADERDVRPVVTILQFHVLSLEVLREAVYPSCCPHSLNSYTRINHILANRI